MNTIFSYQRVNFDSLMQLNIQLNKNSFPDREEASIIYISESIKKITSSHFYCWYLPELICFHGVALKK